MKIEGHYNTAQVMTDTVDTQTLEQIRSFLNEPFTKGEQVVIMPDTHAGKGAVIGTTMTITGGKICPNLVGVDIGCGIHLAKISTRQAVSQKELKQLDEVIKRHIPHGAGVNRQPVKTDINLDELSFKPKNANRIRQSVGSLGGGNHFIEINQMADGYGLMVHSGSRGLGFQVANHHQRIAEKATDHLVQHKDLAYLEGDLLEDYLKDMRIAQRYAKINRSTLLERIARHMNWQLDSIVDSVHNYIGEDGVLRKGATDARDGQLVIIPINMRDGAILGRGLGNPEWNNSAPHGAGRLMSRTAAKQAIPLKHFKQQMAGIYSTSVSQKTLDEAPDAYKPLSHIMENLHETIDVVDRLKPIYNFKA